MSDHEISDHRTGHSECQKGGVYTLGNNVIACARRAETSEAGTGIVKAGWYG